MSNPSESFAPRCEAIFCSGRFGAGLVFDLVQSRCSTVL